MQQLYVQDRSNLGVITSTIKHTKFAIKWSVYTI